MSYTMKTKIANRKNYGSKRSLNSIKYIVIHYTGNDGDTDENNGKYFANNIVKASAHYFVDDDSITQSVPDDYVAYSVGGKRYANYKTTGGAKYYGKATNSNTLNIELCDDVKNGKVYPSAGTIANAVELTKQKMKQYNIPASRVIRHFDVTGKSCPAYWTNNSKWNSDFLNKLGGSVSENNTGTSSDTSGGKEPATTSSKITVDGYWGKNTTRRLQQIFGTAVDGMVSNQFRAYQSVNPGLDSGWEWQSSPSGYSPLIKAIQKKVGVTQDGHIGPKTIRAIQKWLGCAQDGCFSRKSPCIKKLQEWCNNQ